MRAPQTSNYPTPRHVEAVSFTNSCPFQLPYAFTEPAAKSRSESAAHRLRRHSSRIFNQCRLAALATHFRIQTGLLGSGWIARFGEQSLRGAARGLEDVPDSAAGDDVNHCTRSADG